LTRACVLLVILLTSARLQADDTPEPGPELDRLESACDQHDQKSCARLAGLYIFGDGATLRPDRARAFLRGVCTIGYGKDHMDACTTSTAGLACRRLGDIYANGEGADKNPPFAAGYYRMASARGDATSSAALARMFESGSPLPKSPESARTALRKACGQKSFLTEACGISQPRVAEYQKQVAAVCEGLGSEGETAADSKETVVDSKIDDSDPFGRVGGTIKEPRKVQDQAPAYPDQARSKRIQGTVVLEAILDVDGHVDHVKIMKGVVKMLDEAAIGAVRNWVYTPTLVDGIPVPVIMTVTVTFRLTR
jgi:TonB family protein